MRFLVVPNSDWTSAPVSGRMNFIFDRIGTRHHVDVVHFRYGMFRNERVLETSCNLVDFGLMRSGNLAVEYLMHAPSHLARFNRLLGNHRYDVIVLANLLPSLLITMLRGTTPVVLDLFDRFDQSAAMHYPDRPIAKAVVQGGSRILLRTILKAADAVVTVADEDVDYVRRMTDARIPLYTIPNGIETARFRPADKESAKARFGLSGTTVLGFTGLLEKWLDLDTVIELLPEARDRLGDLHLLIVGGSYYSSYDDELRSRARDLGLSATVTVTGMVPYAEVSAYVGAVDVCLNPRRPLDMNTGAISNKLLGYLSCGRPVLSCNNPAAEVRFQHVYPYTRETFVDTLERLLRDLPSPEAVRAETHGYDWDDVAMRFEDTLKEVARSKPRMSCRESP